MKKTIVFALCLMMVASLAMGCQAPQQPAAAPAEAAATVEKPVAEEATASEPGEAAPYKIGVFMRYNDDTGRQMRAIITKAFEKQNAQGGIDGHQLELFIYDTDGNAENAVNILNRLVSDDKVLLVIGPTTSTNALAVLDLTVSSEIVTITPQSTNTSITRDYANEWFFRNSVADCYQSYSLVDYLVGDRGFSNIGYIHSTNSQGQGQFDDFTSYLKEKYSMEVGIEQTFNEGDVDFKSQLLAIKNYNPDVLVISGHEKEVGLVASQRLEVGIPEDLPFAGYNGMTSADFSTIAGPACVGAIIASPWSPTATDEASVKFLEDYAAELTAPDANAALAYDCVNTVFYALSGLELGLTEETLKADRLAIRDKLTTIKNFPNLTGTVNYGPESTQLDKDAKNKCAIWEMQPDYTYTLLKSAS